MLDELVKKSAFGNVIARESSFFYIYLLHFLLHLIIPFLSLCFGTFFFSFSSYKIDLSVIEFQKCGLPHAHILITLNERSKLKTMKQIDYIICAKIPDEATDPDLYNLVNI